MSPLQNMVASSVLLKLLAYCVKPANYLYTLSWFLSSKPAECPAFRTMKLVPSQCIRRSPRLTNKWGPIDAVQWMKGVDTDAFPLCGLVRTWYLFLFRLILKKKVLYYFFIIQKKIMFHYFLLILYRRNSFIRLPNFSQASINRSCSKYLRKIIYVFLASRTIENFKIALLIPTFCIFWIIVHFYFDPKFIHLPTACNKQFCSINDWLMKILIFISCPHNTQFKG